jgi:hypothetical protein
MKETTKAYLWGIYLGLVIMWVVFAVLTLTGVFKWNSQTEADIYKDAFKMTCRIYNNLTDVANTQTEMIETCYNQAPNSIQRLDKLDCGIFG